MTRLDRRSPLAAGGSAWPWPTSNAAHLATCFDGCGALTLTRERWRRNSRGHDVIEYLQERRCVRFTCIPSRGVRMQTFDVPAGSRAADALAGVRASGGGVGMKVGKRPVDCRGAAY